MPNTVPMVHIDTLKTADVHPNEVVNWKSQGWREAPQAAATLPPPPGPGSTKTLSLPGKK